MSVFGPDDDYFLQRERGKLYAHRRDGQYRCDFCLVRIDLATVWTYPAVDMPIAGPPSRPFEASEDDWAVCPECHELLAASKIGPLVERIVKLQPINEPETAVRYYPPVSLRRRYARENVLRFLDARKAPPYQGAPF